MSRSTLILRTLPVLAILFIGPASRAATINRDPVPATPTRRFSVPLISDLLGAPDGRLYALASDRLPDGVMPRSFWWTRAPGERRWTLLADQPPAYYPWLLAPDPAETGGVYAATPEGRVLHSGDGGNTWEQRGQAPGSPRQLLATAAGLLVMGELGSVCTPCRSSDGGRTWTSETVELSVGRLVSASADSQVIYAFTPGVILRSIDGARSFQDVSPATLVGASGLAVAPSDANVVYAVTTDPVTGFLHRTTDGGASWVRLSPPEPGLIWSGPVVDPASASHLFLLGGLPDSSGSRQLFESRDGGITWTWRSGEVNATQLRLAGSGGDLEVDAFGRRGIFSSGDCGEHWIQQDAGITADSQLLLAGARNGDLYLTHADGGTWRSRDAGTTWERRGTVPWSQPFYYASLSVDPFDPARLLAFDGSGYGLWWGDDGGKSWAFRKGPRSRKGTAYINAVAFDPHRRNTVYAATTEDIWRSSDRGVTWSLFSGSLPSGTDCNHSGCFEIRDAEAIVPDPFAPNRFYARAHTYGFFRTTDNGVTWKELKSPELAAVEGPTLRPDPKVAGRFYWGLDVETRVYQSDRSGLPPWKVLLRTSAIGPVGNPSWLTFDPAGRPVVQLEMHSARILRRLGEDWERIPVALEHQEEVRLLEPLVPAPGGKARAFFLVPGLGLFRADLPEPH